VAFPGLLPVLFMPFPRLLDGDFRPDAEADSDALPATEYPRLPSLASAGLGNDEEAVAIGEQARPKLPILSALGLKGLNVGVREPFLATVLGQTSKVYPDL
jgi:hypothetical protein